MGAASEHRTGSIFQEVGLSRIVTSLKEEIRLLYREDRIPWVIGYSGGKDSTAIVQLVWLAIAELPLEQRHKPIHVISTDTLVENPIVAAWVSRSLESMSDAARRQQVPFYSHRLTPEVGDTFWVNLLGRGYPAPRHKFRWCTERLKIKPSNAFIHSVVRENGEAILVLGTRRAESVARARNMDLHARHALRERLTPNGSLPNSLVYTPIENWSNDDVWAFLTQVNNPWGYNNHDLMSMYRGASADGECPLVVDTSTPSCGNSRFGCYVCTLVDQDKSMGAMIQNDHEKEWMEPLLELRNELDFRGEDKRNAERKNRDFRRITGKLTYYTTVAGEGKLVPGPYTQKARAHWLRRVLEVQCIIQKTGPVEVREMQLLTPEELQEIRRIWVVDKHEIEDLLPRIYEEVLGKPYPGPSIDENLVFDAEAIGLLRDQCANDELHFEMVRNLLDIERRYRTMTSRRGLFADLEDTVERCFYDDEADALERAKQLSVKYGENIDTDSNDEIPEALVQIRLPKSQTTQPELFDPAKPNNPVAQQDVHAGRTRR
jgi:DNA sulfur modification protein DndC